MDANIINVTHARAGKIKMHCFTMALSIFTPFPSAIGTYYLILCVVWKKSIGINLLPLND
jgi:hypothetical protein